MEYISHSEKGRLFSSIAFVLQHKSLESLKRYLDQLTMEDRENFSKYLFKGTGRSLSDSDDDIFDPPPPKLKAKLPKVKKTSTTNQTETNVPINAIAVVEPNSPEKFLSSTLGNQNVIQMYKQNPIEMLVGTHLSNCTININMPK